MLKYALGVIWLLLKVDNLSKGERIFKIGQHWWSYRHELVVQIFGTQCVCVFLLFAYLSLKVLYSLCIYWFFLF